MTATDLEILGALKSIDGTLKDLLALSKSKRAGTTVDLDHPANDPIVKAKDPRNWSGPSMQGRHFSETSHAYLVLLADRSDYFASIEPDPKKAQYNKRDAAIARAWADRLLAHPKPAPVASEDTSTW